MTFWGKTLTILLEETTTTATVYMEARDVCSTICYIYMCSKHVLGPALREMGRTETSASILFELTIEVSRCLVLQKGSCFWTQAGIEVQAAQSKLRVIQFGCLLGWVFRILAVGLGSI